MPELGRKVKEEYFRSLPSPVSGRGPATVSSQSLSRRPMDFYLITKMTRNPEILDLGSRREERKREGEAPGRSIYRRAGALKFDQVAARWGDLGR